MLVLHNDRVIGVDAAGVKYDGSAQITPAGNINVNIKLTVPANVNLVQGISKPHPWELSFNVSILEQDLGNGNPVAVSTPVGPVHVIFKKLRDF